MDPGTRCPYHDERGQCCLPDKHFVEHLPLAEPLSLLQAQWYVHEARLAYSRGKMDGKSEACPAAVDVVTPGPVPMRLACEGCGELHIDEGEFATKPHHTHACQKCGLTWRPAVVCTVGVRFLPGFKNAPVGPTAYERAVMHNAKKDGWCSCKEPRRLRPEMTLCADCDRCIPPGPAQDSRLAERCTACGCLLWVFDYDRGVVPVSCRCRTP